ncbi:F-box protein At3g12350 [Punica granatum]|uniref:F-box protein n=2 Tax=Punica granatum TaxID=22663 RepID=A0A218WE55_PUNGR|nr:F-box protein At3g12350 [Punica granatum]OWM70758.1 hypothetical protein CDL15_Pgr014431 [Punica granatum]PKI41695.1 hypothetical protein CRG98_037897 [Punica granatum]
MDSSSHAIPFGEFPEDVQLCILSFLSLPEIAAFACTSKRSLSLCSGGSRLWHALCDRRWGSKTLISRWGEGKISFRLLYRTLNEWDSLIGFWRRSGHPRPSSTAASPPQLVFFEWGPKFLAGSRVSPSQNGTYGVVKSPFLWLSLSPSGEAVNFLDPNEKSSGFPSEEAVREGDFIPVNVSFMGASHLVVEENVQGFGSSRFGFRRSSSSVNLTNDEEEVNGVDTNGLPGSLPDQYMSEMYQYFANRTSPGGNGSSRRQRRREKERQGRRKWEPEHFIKIVNCSPTTSRPLQGLWKGIAQDSKLDFYLVTYDDIGGIACRRVGDSSAERFSGCPLVFWTSNSNYIKPPFPPKELFFYDNRVHPRAGDPGCYLAENEAETVSHILHINSSFDLLIPDMADNAPVNPRHVEGRIWQYENGTFGFGFLRDNFIVDLKHIAQDGQLLDVEEPDKD